MQVLPPPPHEEAGMRFVSAAIQVIGEAIVTASILVAIAIATRW